VAGLDPQLAAQGVEQLGVAEHAVGDVVGEQHPVAADRLRVQEAVEAGDAFDPRPRQAEGRGDVGEGGGGSQPSICWAWMRICSSSVAWWR
jgi:hypothetical protein